METRQKNILTILLIIVIVVIIGIIGYLGFELITANYKESQASEITDEFDSQVPTVTEDEIIESQEMSENSGQEAGSAGGTGSRSSGESSGVNVNGYLISGTIRIPATGIKYSIFSNPTRQNLEKGIILLYTTNGLNKAGNTVLAGHNYRNRQFFSKNKNLKVGDSIIIKDSTGLEITYSIYNKFVTNSTDASFYQRDTAGKREITLTTCTDQGTKTGERLIIFAKEV